METPFLIKNAISFQKYFLLLSSLIRLASFEHENNCRYTHDLNTIIIDDNFCIKKCFWRKPIYQISKW